MSVERPITSEHQPKQTVFDRVINAIKDPRLPRKAALILASLLVAASVSASNGALPVSPRPSEASFSPSPALSKTATETIIPTPFPTPTLKIIPIPTAEPTPKPTPTLEPTPTTSPTQEPTPTILRTPKATPKTPEIITTPTAEMIAELDALNTYRKDRGLPELTYSNKLGAIANWKAMDLSITWPKLPHDGDPHIDSKGRNVGDRDEEMKLTGWQVAGENVYESNYSNPKMDKEAQHVIDAFDASPKHKEIMLDEWDYAAVGYYVDPNTGMHYVAQEFMKSTHYKPAPTVKPTLTPTPEITPIITPVPTLSPTEKPTPTFTPTPTPEPTPIITPPPTPTPESSVAYNSNAVLVFDARRRIRQSRQRVYRRSA